MSSNLGTVIHCCSVTKSSLTLFHPMDQASLSFTIFCSLLKLTFIESVMPSNYLILCCPLLLLPSIFFSVRFFSSEFALYLSFWYARKDRSLKNSSLGLNRTISCWFYPQDFFLLSLVSLVDSSSIGRVSSVYAS